MPTEPALSQAEIEALVAEAGAWETMSRWRLQQIVRRLAPALSRQDAALRAAQDDLDGERQDHRSTIDDLMALRAKLAKAERAVALLPEWREAHMDVERRGVNTEAAWSRSFDATNALLDALAAYDADSTPGEPSK